LSELIDRLLSRSDPLFEAIESMQDWFVKHQQATALLDDSIDRAILGGFVFRQTAFAFASAYQSAMESMFSLDGMSIAALCHTEKGVKKPREMHTELRESSGELTLNGAKSFVSGGADAGTLMITALDLREETDRSQAKLVVIKLDADHAGLNVQTLPTLPFVPELSHAALTLSEIKIKPEDIVPGDGYADYVKPFRSEEDLHILAALTGQRLRLALENNQQEISQRLLGLLSAIRSLNEADRSAATTHLLLAGIKSGFEDVLALHDPLIKQSHPDLYSAWQRDKALLNLAGSAQSLRTQKAWASISR